MDYEKLKNMPPEKMMENAQHIWQMLDDMAESDPQGYRNFIDKQMKDGKEMTKLPEPHMCVQTRILKPKPEIVFINIFEWDRVPEPKSDEDPIPVMSGTPYKGKDETGTYTIISVAFCQKVLKEFGIESSLTAERKMLINLAIDFIRDTQKMDVSRNYTLLKKPVLYKGALKKAVDTLSSKINGRDKKFEKDVEQLQKQFLGPSGSVGIDKDSLLGQLSNISNEQNSTDSLEEEYVVDDPISPSEKNNMVAPEEPVINIPGIGNTSKSQKNKKLIEELGAGANFKKEITGSVLDNNTCLKEPTFSLKNESGAKVIKIQLPGVCSVQECELNISQKDLHLIVEEKYELLLPFDNKINDAEAQAKFSKKSSVLTLTLPQL